MKDNIVWTVVLVNLLCASVALGYVVAKPAHVRAFFSEPMMMEPSQMMPARPSPQAGSEARRTSTREPAARRTTQSDSPRPPARGERGGPPPRSASSDLDEIAITKEARYIGPVMRQVSGSPPPQQLYPRRVWRRTVDGDRGTVEVQLAVQNMSGYFWEYAQLVWRSDGHPTPQAFEVRDWRDKEIALFRYRFPADEFEQRLQRLRIVEVTGDRISSALADIDAENRVRVLEEILSDDQREAGGVDTSRMSEQELREALLAQLRLDLPSAAIVPETIDTSGLDPDLEDHGRAGSLLEQSHEQARRVESALVAFIEVINDRGYTDAMDGAGRDRLRELRFALADFETSANELALLASRTRDPRIRALERQANTIALELVRALERIELQVRSAAPEFQILQPT